MFIGNTLDPVTPLQDAKTMAKAFGGSLLVHDGYGHSSIAHVGAGHRRALSDSSDLLVKPSLCTAKAIRSYFRDGQLPRKDAVCHVQKSWPFKEHDFSKLASEDAGLLQALEGLSRTFV